MPYFIYSSCPMSLGMFVAGPALLLGTQTSSLCSLVYKAVPSAFAHSYFLPQGIYSASGKSRKHRQLEQPPLHLFSLLCMSLHRSSCPLCPKNRQGEGKNKTMFWQLSKGTQIMHKRFFWEICAEPLSELPPGWRNLALTRILWWGM